MNQNPNSNNRNIGRRGMSVDGFNSPKNRFGRTADNRPLGVNNRRESPLGDISKKESADTRKPDGFYPINQKQIRNNSQSQKVNNPAVFVDRPDDRKQLKSKKGLFRRRKKGPLSRKKKILRAIAILLIIVGLVTGFLFYKGYIAIGKVLQGGGKAAALEENVDPSKLNGEGDGRVNILLLGRGGEGHDGADLTDTMILASIDPIAKDAALVSIPRDLRVKANESGAYTKLNSVFAEGKEGAYSRSNNLSKKDAENAGFNLLEKTVENTLGIPIHYHLMVDFSGFEQAVNNVNGIDFNAPTSVQEQMRINGQNYFLNVTAGQQHMDGFKALAYARSRHTSPRGDFDRSERQRVMITALKDKIMSPSTFSNPQKVSNLLTTFGDHVQTNFNTQDLQRLYQLSQQIPGDKIASVGLSDPPNSYVTTQSIAGISYVVPTAGLTDYSQLQSYLRNVLKDSYIRNENASIMVLNGTTTAGLASQKADELKSFGYNITGVANSPIKDLTTTLIVDMRSGQKKYTKNYLEKRFNVTTQTNLPDASISPGNADFVIILGSDQAR